MLLLLLLLLLLPEGRARALAVHPAPAPAAPSGRPLHLAARAAPAPALLRLLLHGVGRGERAMQPRRVAAPGRRGGRGGGRRHGHGQRRAAVLGADLALLHRPPPLAKDLIDLDEMEMWLQNMHG